MTASPEAFQRTPDANPDCTGATDCPVDVHVHGCYADDTGAHCNMPAEHALDLTLAPERKEPWRIQSLSAATWAMERLAAAQHRIETSAYQLAEEEDHVLAVVRQWADDRCAAARAAHDRRIKDPTKTADKMRFLLTDWWARQIDADLPEAYQGRDTAPPADVWKKRVTKSTALTDGTIQATRRETPWQFVDDTDLVAFLAEAAPELLKVGLGPKAAIVDRLVVKDRGVYLATDAGPVPITRRVVDDGEIVDEIPLRLIPPEATIEIDVRPASWTQVPDGVTMAWPADVPADLLNGD